MRVSCGVPLAPRAGVGRAHLVVGIASLAWLAPPLAHAQVHVGALDGRSWPEIVSDWVEDPGSQGSVVSLCLREEADRCLPCDRYELAIDPAIAVGACDPISGATSVLLVDRSALFDHTHAVPVPRSITVRARLATGTTAESVAPRAAGTGLGCSVSVRPYVRDLEHGTTVMLGPDAYDVRVARVHADVEPSADGGFVISSSDSAVTTFSYDVIERATGAVVLVGQATLACTAIADVPATEPGAVAPLPVALTAESVHALVRPVPASGGGIRLRPRDSAQAASEGLFVAAAAIGAASAIALLGIGIGTAMYTAPGCARYAGSFGVTPYGSTAPAPSAPVCIEMRPGRPSETPAELTWSMVGGLGLAAALGISALIVDALGRPSPDDPVRFDLAAGPTGASADLTLRF
jgi:hypothetical protein